MENGDMCPVCGSNYSVLLYPDSLGTDLPQFDYSFTPYHMRTYKIVKCRACTHAFCIIPHTDLWENYQSTIDPEYINRQFAHIKTAEQVVAVMQKYADGKTLIDIGCSTGDFLSIAKDYYAVEGLELSQWSSKLAKERGFTVHTCKINELPADAKYDIITLWGVIEHLESPKDEIESLKTHLNPGGFICVYTGDAGSWLARLMGKKWWYIQGQHIQFFSIDSLTKLFSDAGFSTLVTTYYPITTDLKTLSKSFYRYTLIKPLSQLLLENRFVRDITLTLTIPGEILAVFKKE